MIVVCIFHLFRASVNSVSADLPFKNILNPVSDKSGAAKFSSFSRDAQARAVTTSAFSGLICSILLVNIVAGAFNNRAASRKKLAFRASDSIRMTSGAPRIASTRPGNPAPLPKSTIRCAASGSWSIS